MARFFASIKGRRGEATRLGDSTSGLQARINGWNIGVDVEIRADGGGEVDVVYVTLTAGSNGYKRQQMFRAYSDGRVVCGDDLKAVLTEEALRTQGKEDSDGK